MIDEIMEKDISRKDFITKSGLIILALALFPSMIENVFKENENVTFIDNKMFLNKEQIWEVK